MTTHLPAAARTGGRGPSGQRPRYSLDVDEREATAWHEAGHAVAAAALGRPVRYVSLRPRDRDTAGHVMLRWSDERNPLWLPDMIITAAGMVAEDWLRCGEDRWDTAAGGRDDLHELRGQARYTWYRAHPDDGHDYRLDPAVDASWGVRDIAIHAWRQTHLLLVQHGDALREVAEELAASPRAMPGRRVRELVAQAGTTAEDDDFEQLRANLALIDFWPAEHSRLRWDIPRPRSAGPRAASSTPDPAPAAGEIRGLVSAHAYAQAMHHTLAEQALSIDAFLAALHRADVPVAGTAAAQRARTLTSAAAAAWATAATALARQTCVRDAYTAAPDAGAKTWVTAQ
jgi:hypothetical protein